MSYTFGKENTLFVVDALVDSLCRLGVGGKLLKFTRAPKYLNVLNVPSSYVPPNSQNLRFLALLLKNCPLSSPLKLSRKLRADSEPIPFHLSSRRKDDGSIIK